MARYVIPCLLLLFALVLFGCPAKWAAPQPASDPVDVQLQWIIRACQAGHVSSPTDEADGAWRFMGWLAVKKLAARVAARH